jgi:hypothetical protein
VSTKCYIFVDESGQDTAGRFFIVGIVAVQGPVEPLRRVCEDVEARSGKGARKWSKTALARRSAYVAELLRHAEARGTLWYAVFNGRQDYGACTLEAIAAVLTRLAAADATVFVDGLTRAAQQQVGLALRRMGCPVDKVRGREDERDALIRLADALCGFVRAQLDGEAAFAALWDEAARLGAIRRI